MNDVIVKNEGEVVDQKKAYCHLCQHAVPLFMIKNEAGLMKMKCMKRDEKLWQLMGEPCKQYEFSMIRKMFAANALFKGGVK